MRRPLVLSGGPAAGKTTCGRAIAESRARGAFVDADDIRQLIVAGAEPLWRGEEGVRQLMLGAENVAALARNLTGAGVETVVADVVTGDSLPVYRRDLPDALVIHLRLSLAEARRRARTREVYLTDDEFEAVHALVADPPDVDVVLDVDGMGLDGQLAAISAAWERG